VERYDVIVAGVGGMGSATLFELSCRGARTLGIEQFRCGHDRGSSHGETRIIRLAYYEHLAYVPLLRRAYARWRELESLTGERMLVTTGSIDAGPPDSKVFAGSLESCLKFELPHEVLTGAELSARFPAFNLPRDTMAVLQADGGYLRPERAVVALANAARAQGATIHENESVVAWETTSGGVRVRTAAGDYWADTLVISAGAWLASLVPSLAPAAVPERQVVAWFDTPPGGLFDPVRFPVFNVALPEGRYYGFPSIDEQGFKVGRYHHLEEQVAPARLDRRIHDRDLDALRACVTRYFPAAGDVRKASVCMFTNTPDEHFIIDRLPHDPRVFVVSPCSGHGFKFCSVVGEIVADLVLDQATTHDISLFALSRLSSSIREG
jgi:sarcosine oxidase